MWGNSQIVSPWAFGFLEIHQKLKFGIKILWNLLLPPQKLLDGTFLCTACKTDTRFPYWHVSASRVCSVWQQSCLDSATSRQRFSLLSSKMLVVPSLKLTRVVNFLLERRRRPLLTPQWELPVRDCHWKVILAWIICRCRCICRQLKDKTLIRSACSQSSEEMNWIYIWSALAFPLLTVRNVGTEVKKVNQPRLIMLQLLFLKKKKKKSPEFKLSPVNS